MTMATNKSIREFFKPKVVMEPATGKSAPSPAVKGPPAPTMRASNIPASSFQMAPRLPSAPNSSNQRSYTSSLSPPPSSDASDQPHLEQRENVPPQSLPAKRPSDRIIQNSDDEDDSDDSLEDLSTILAARFPNTANRSKTSGDKAKPTTPTAPRYKTRTNNFHVSPMPVLSKKKFDLKSLVSHAQDDEAAEATTQRYKAMLEEPGIEEDDVSALDPAKRGKFKHSALLESVVASGEDGGAHRVARAIQRTEATVTEQRWYFFETGIKQAKPERKRFPVASVPDIWKDVLVDPQMRQQTFAFGFAEDMVSMGHDLPDELFLWILDEVSVESRDPLRSSYLNVMKQSDEQIKRLITVEAISSTFLRLGATPEAQAVEGLKPVNKLKNPYPRRDWGNLLATIKFFGQVAKLLNEKPRRHLIFVLLKLSLDRIVSENADIQDAVQETIARLCQYINDWDDTCIFVCESIFKSTSSSPLRLQAVECISSASSRTHDLRRRLAACFFHDSLIHASKSSYYSTSLGSIMNTLHSPRFRIIPATDTSPGTDYHELRALVYLLDVTLDDGLSSDRDLSDKEQEEIFNEDIEEFGKQLDWIGSKIQTGGAAFFTRLETKEALTLVKQRAVGMLRTKSKLKHSWYNENEEKEKKRLETFEKEKKGMASFLKKQVAE
ncbi:hypothetical protein ONS95_014605 [Cadophora gregata]|uniref:uncharacterized protein n=1 Tax=Cadophora gregata TaxID=51156 RepID=UPI0026DAED10|nr:uncharacterized protein ONS95_014605 [Cadophora gregata]KAK0112884.1 hypothetical protein ONS95_014605 [Cadophora gregata]KAK0125012.1 hypothetical protein ONS96_008879 [Cadophora gregata f. sp. sojae]